jgi:hypothetical protein
VAAPREKKLAPEYRFVPGRQEHQIGVTIDGGFVPFATVSAGYAAQLVENAEQVAANADASNGEDA